MDYDELDKKIITAIHNGDMAEALKHWRKSDFCSITCGENANVCNKVEKMRECLQHLAKDYGIRSIETPDKSLSYYVKLLREHLQKEWK